MTLPVSVIDAYGLDASTVAPITIGLVNETYVANRSADTKLIVQRLHPVFGATVNQDIDAITTHLASCDMLTPRLVHTRSGANHVDADGVWRALTFLEGRVHTEVSSPAIAREAGLLAGRFQRSVASLNHRFHFTRDGVHDTVRHLEKLRALAASVDPSDEVVPLARAIETAIRALPALPKTKTRILHGDLKITNVLFSSDGTRGIALLDLDTMQHGPLAFELGDALRSWSNPRGESALDAYFDASIASAALDGFREGAGAEVSEDELATVPLGTATIAFELAARFATDAIEDRYFGWDTSRFASRREHNVVRARSQLALGYDVARKTLGLELAG